MRVMVRVRVRVKVRVRVTLCWVSGEGHAEGGLVPGPGPHRSCPGIQSVRHGKARHGAKGPGAHALGLEKKYADKQLRF